MLNLREMPAPQDVHAALTELRQLVLLVCDRTSATHGSVSIADF